MRSFIVVVALLALAGCSTLTLAPSDFAWPVMSELTADKAGTVSEDRYHLSFNIKPLMQEELQDSVNGAGKSVSVIRDRQGFYFVTGPKFKNVYVFQHAAEGLALVSSFNVHPTGLANPEFNQRPPHIQLLNGRDKTVLLTRSGVFTPPTPAPAPGGGK